MRKVIFGAVAAAACILAIGTGPSQAGSLGRYEVVGVEGNDMLKMRAGPGTGFNVIVGLPNGSVLQVHKCERSGATRWCHVSLEKVRGLKGYVSWAYLREM